ncbi:MAG: gluconokinase [Paracoccus sp.]|jgi:gluconokinase|nr:gluconokinase [Paracoccus sp. (in: a-proteobacteria)]|tara:strand:+ start:1306 stop:1869 length:564 start_codon:yes stop_codon:yes gene_type:complete
MHDGREEGRASVMQQRPVLVMGICGVGKSTIAAAIAESLDGRFIEADSYHDSASVARMRAGLPLTDEMRWGWLDRLGDAVVAAQKRAVLACSALGRAHRDRLRARTGPLDIVFLHGDRDIIAARMQARRDHYMPASLIDSQLAALQPPDTTTENAIWIDVANPPDRITEIAVAALAAVTTATGGEKE